MNTGTRIDDGTGLGEWYDVQGCSDGRPVGPPTPERADAMVAARAMAIRLGETDR
jgi:hypothetical protein